MDIVETTVTITKPIVSPWAVPKVKAISISDQLVVPKHKKSASYKKVKQSGKAVKMSLKEFTAIENEKQGILDKAKEKRVARKARKERGWTTIEKPEIIRAEIRLPSKRALKLSPPFIVNKAQPNTTLILKNLPREGVNDKDLKKFFSSNCGQVRYVKVLMNDGKNTGLAFIRFMNRDGSDKGLKMNEFICNGRKIYVDYAADRR